LPILTSSNAEQNAENMTKIKDVSIAGSYDFFFTLTVLFNSKILGALKRKILSNITNSNFFSRSESLFSSSSQSAAAKKQKLSRHATSAEIAPIEEVNSTLKCDVETTSLEGGNIYPAPPINPKAKMRLRSSTAPQSAFSASTLSSSSSSLISSSSSPNCIFQSLSINNPSSDTLDTNIRNQIVRKSDTKLSKSIKQNASRSGKKRSTHSPSSQNSESIVSNAKKVQKKVKMAHMDELNIQSSPILSAAAAETTSSSTVNDLNEIFPTEVSVGICDEILITFLHCVGLRC